MKFQCHTFFGSQDIKQNALLSLYLGNGSHHKLSDLYLIIYKNMEKEGNKNTKT